MVCSMINSDGSYKDIIPHSIIQYHSFVKSATSSYGGNPRFKDLHTMTRIAKLFAGYLLPIPWISLYLPKVHKEHLR